jgi:hypothetical protein
MTRYLGRAQNVRIAPVSVLAWAVVACGFLWFSCCGGVP